MLTQEEKIRKAKREYMRKYREKNKEKVNKLNREWRKANPEKVKEYQERFWEKKAKELEKAEC